MRRLIYLFGCGRPWFRKIIHKLTGNWYWGIIIFVKDNLITDPNPITVQDLYTKDEWLDKQLEDIFSYVKKDKIVWITSKGQEQLKDLAKKD